MIHEGKRFPCSICGKLLTTQGSLQLHVKNVHEDKEDSKASCRICGKLMRRGQISKHEKIHLEDLELRFPCNTCNKVFTAKRNLIAHMEHHHTTNPKKPVECPKCGKTFARIDLLKKHIKSMHESK